MVPVDERPLVSKVRTIDLPLESILDLLTGLLEVALHLVGLTLNFELVVPGRSSRNLLELAFGDLGIVLGLIFVTHG